MLKKLSYFACVIFKSFLHVNRSKFTGVDRVCSVFFFQPAPLTQRWGTVRVIAVVECSIKKVKSTSRCQTNNKKVNVSRNRSCPVSAVPCCYCSSSQHGMSQNLHLYQLQIAPQQDRSVSLSQASEPFWLVCNKDSLFRPESVLLLTSRTSCPSWFGP